MVRTGGARLHVWGLLRDQDAYLRPVEEHLGDRARVTYDADWDARALVAARPDVVVCVNDWPSEIVECLDAARAAGIPSLVLQDGILEWRCQYENPLFGAGGGAPQHQPVMADRIACIGPQSARHIASWGNETRVEVTGMPRMDWLLGREAPPRRRPGARVLVMTAKNPGFTPEQRTATLRSLQDVKAFVDARPDLEVMWRVSNGLVPTLGISNRFQQLGGNELVDLIGWADAIITTPSTAMLEGMLMDRPVAALDYHNVPRFAPTAWTISAPEHIAPVVGEMLAAPANKMAFQRYCLAESLRLDGPATPRVAALIERMASRQPESRPEPAPSSVAARTGGLSTLPTLAELYPDQPVFADTDLHSLQARVARLQRDNASLRDQLRRRTLTDRLYRLGQAAISRLDPHRVERA